MFEKFDGTNRPPRAIQTQALEWIKGNWDSRVLALNLPTGVGKSAILRAIQVQFPTSVGITPSNILLDQYRETYPTLNYLKGATEYDCKEVEGFSCQDMKLTEQKPCEGCPYKTCRIKALTESTVFNPISYHYFTNMKAFEQPEILIVDECHKLVDVLMLLVDISFRKTKFQYPEIKTEHELLEWLNVLRAKLDLLIKKYRKSGNAKKILEHSRREERLRFLIKAFSNNPQDFVFYTQDVSYRNTKEEYLFIKPVKPPKWLLEKMFGGFKKIILMSATLFQYDINEMGFKNYRYLDLDSPIPIRNRRVMYKPSGFPMNYKTTPEDMANYIKRILIEYPNQNSVIHLSYAWATKVKPFFPHCLFNTPETKNDVLEKFKKNGGIWIASGCSEGLDLPNEQCRLTIIPIIMLGNIKDPVVEKQLSQPGGRTRYELEAIKTTIQQAGRGTRGVEDYSLTVIGDNKFPNLILRNRQLIPKSFTDAIMWSTNVKT